MENNDVIKIFEKLSEIGADVKAMHRRQDITNGRIAKNEEKVVELEKSNIGISEQIKGLQRRDTDQETANKEKAADRKYWSRQFVERVIWIVLILCGVVLTKVGIINLNI